MTKQSSDIDLELYELVFPGQLIGGGTAEIEKSIIAQFRLVLPNSY